MHISGGVLRLVMRGLVSDLLTCVCLRYGSWKNNYCMSWSSPSSMNPIQIVTKNFLQTQFSPLSPKIGPIPIILGQFPRWLLSFRTFSFLITKRNHRNCEASFFPSPPLNESLLSRPDMNYHSCHIPEASIGMLLLQKSGYIKVIGFYSNVFLRIAQRELSIQKHWLLFFAAAALLNNFKGHMGPEKISMILPPAYKL